MLCALIGLLAAFGCDDGEHSKAMERQRELEQQVKAQGETITEQEHFINQLKIAIPTVLFVALFVGTLMGLKGKNDARKSHLTDMKENEEHDK